MATTSRKALLEGLRRLATEGGQSSPDCAGLSLFFVAFGDRLRLTSALSPQMSFKHHDILPHGHFISHRPRKCKRPERIGCGCVVVASNRGQLQMVCGFGDTAAGYGGERPRGVPPASCPAIGGRTSCPRCRGRASLGTAPPGRGGVTTGPATKIRPHPRGSPIFRPFSA